MRPVSVSFPAAAAGKCFAIAIAGTALLLPTILDAEAQSRRPLSTSMTCSQAQSMINQRGAVVMSTGQYTFDRYVSNRNFCERGEFLVRANIPTKDKRRCTVQRCDSASPFEFNR
ncbi:hypothetical protein K1718_24780 [Roseibium porphyridii]|uniref:Secreted protein n=1 Tax=Roseibium porphyridii TaxID=2866279 RepID=A0ABY8F1I1_9HYPH|nr:MULTISPECIES: hypothetical protein [Stappiaceae]QFT34329.1 hypothetical protein FIV00_27780 [Labrenzia sp. THAF82]WFE89333.1 hypothetical protein K1718_24780 [Roseibium sp. KMA01]